MFENDWDRNHVKEIEIPTLGRQNSWQQTKHTPKKYDLMTYPRH